MQGGERVYEEFDDNLITQWCELHVTYVIQDQQRLANLILNCAVVELQKVLISPTVSIGDLICAREKTDQLFLNAYAQLCLLANSFWQKPRPQQLYGHIEARVNGVRYLLIRHTGHPILNAIDKADQFRPDSELGTDGILNLTYSWQRIEESWQLDIQRSDVFDFLTERHQKIKVGLSPFAGIADMNWEHDANDRRGNDDRIPFWCAGAKDERVLWGSLLCVLEEFKKQQVQIVILPELVFTKKLHIQLSGWLKTKNAFDPIIRLIVAGSRHISTNTEVNLFSNQCTVLNGFGETEWRQGKRQPFKLEKEEAKKLFNLDKPAFEPTDLSPHLVIRDTALGRLATPICLDFLHDEGWQAMQVNVFLVPAMSNNLKRFEGRCKQLGGIKNAATFICNAKVDNKHLPVYAYHPSRKNLLVDEDLKKDRLFIVEVNIDMN